MPIVEKLVIYPVKGLTGIELNQSPINSTGLAFDREWVIADASVQPAKFINQKFYSTLATLGTQIQEDQLILIAKQTGEVFPVNNRCNDASRTSVSIWADVVDAYDQGDEVAAWLQDKLKLSAIKPRLFRFAPQCIRKTTAEGNFGGQSNILFADAAPLLVTNQASLDALNQRLIEQQQDSEAGVPASRFRSNVHLSGLTAWQELHGVQMTHQHQYRMRLITPCERCVVIHICQENGVKMNQFEPTRTLLSSPPNTVPDDHKNNATNHATKRAAYFGMYAQLDSLVDGACVKIGDELSVNSF